MPGGYFKIGMAAEVWLWIRESNRSNDWPIDIPAVVPMVEGTSCARLSRAGVQSGLEEIWND
jgi:hypothetical protein